ncbi:hypothetical protein SASPL_146711 [Salvia splendens]|uniref:polyribonucleotide nucleotidyltransferase n=1 Tax=Salvia splendens TaxID=180675 RepID=A0A8X8Z617_SALSN|nr:hypothetical protein SASPL_146711 [Salvia splendens]
METGRMARFANGSVVLSMEETRVLSTVASAKSDGSRDFLPLIVDYQEKHFAQAHVLIVMVMASVLSSYGKHDPDEMAANAASAAMIFLHRLEKDRQINLFCLSDLNLVYACTKDKTLMIDFQSREISERDLEAALRFAHPEAVKYLEPQLRLAAKAGKQKMDYKLYTVSEDTYERIRSFSEGPIEAVFTDPTCGKFERGEALDNIGRDVKKILEEEGDEEGLKVLSNTVDNVRKKVCASLSMFRAEVIVDGRRLDEVRPLYCEAGHLPVLHGSSIFSRGDTQVLCTVTLGAPGEAQVLDSLVGPSTKRFMLHYSFPPFCTSEVGKRVGLNRCEVGHGTLAEKALLAVMPPEENCPYTVRINSEVMASDGSTSMASVCAGSLALMDAGIPLREHVAGLSVGLISETDPATGEIKDYRILTDILGLEDHLGDMDFKIAGTRNGVTAIQLDIKPAGIPLDIICEPLEPARKGRIQILDHMEEEINVPRTHDDRNSPRILNLKYSNEAIRRLIGPLGAIKRKIEEETDHVYATGGRISVNDGSLTVVAKNQSVLDKVMEKIDFLVGREIVKGGVYKGIVTSIKEYGAFVEFNGGQQGLLHISELAHKPVSRVSDVVSIGQVLNLIVWTDKSVESLSSIVLQSAEMEQENKDNQPAEAVESLSSILIRSATECDEADKSSALNHPSKVDTPLHAKKLTIGTELTAKVHQIRAHGLVLDCGSDIRGMYRFETGSGRKFVIGDKLRVKCSSFSGKESSDVFGAVGITQVRGLATDLSFLTKKISANTYKHVYTVVRTWN